MFVFWLICVCGVHGASFIQIVERAMGISEYIYSIFDKCFMSQVCTLAVFIEPRHVTSNCVSAHGNQVNTLHIVFTSYDQCFESIVQYIV